MYTIIIAQTVEQAVAINTVLPPATRETKVEAFAYGYRFCGHNYAGKRPDAVISLVDLREDDEWVRQCLRPAMTQDAAWILP